MHSADFRSRLIDGDMTVLGEIFEVYHKTLYALAHFILREEDEALDAVQDVFTNLCYKPELWDGIDNLRSYLMMAVRNQCIHRIRSRKAAEKFETQYLRYHLETSQNSTGVAEQFTQKHEEWVIEEMLSRNPRKRRAVIRLFYLEGLKYSEIAERLGVTKDTIKTQLRLARSSFHEFRHLLRIGIVLCCALIP